MTAHEDQKYIEALCKNNSALIEEIYKKCSGQCLKFVQKNSGTAAEAKDVFQEALATLYHKAKSGLILTAPICGYLYPIYKGKWINLLNSKKRKNVQMNLRNLTNDGYIGIETHLEEAQSIEERRERIFLDCFEKLADEVKQLFNLRYKNNMASKEIAKQLNIDENTVNQRFSYYKQKLKDCVKQHHELKDIKQ